MNLTDSPDSDLTSESDWDYNQNCVHFGAFRKGQIVSWKMTQIKEKIILTEKICHFVKVLRFVQ